MLKVTRSLLLFAVGVAAAYPTLASAQSTGAVFVMTNAADKNEVIAYPRAANGTLGDSVSYDTHGRGSGGITDPLESQGSLTLSQDRSAACTWPGMRQCPHVPRSAGRTVMGGAGRCPRGTSRFLPRASRAGGCCAKPTLFCPTGSM